MVVLINFFFERNETISFSTFEDSVGLPVPLYLPLEAKLLLSFSLILCLIFGFKLRLVILSYLRSPETNLGPINYLIWVDQMNGLMYSVVILVRIMTIHSSTPLCNIFGPQFGPSINLISCFYNSGSLFWSYFVAIYRVLFILAQRWLTQYVGIDRFLNFLIVYGLISVLANGSAYNYMDDKGSITKASFHRSNAYIEIMNSYQVIIILI
jgi:hypothetical protein